MAGKEVGAEIANSLFAFISVHYFYWGIPMLATVILSVAGSWIFPLRKQFLLLPMAINGGLLARMLYDLTYIVIPDDVWIWALSETALLTGCLIWFFLRPGS